MGNEGKENSPLEVIQLAEDTRQAYLFIQNEQQAIYELNNKITEESRTTFRQLWLTRIQRYVCDKLRMDELKSMEVLADVNRLETDQEQQQQQSESVQFVEDGKVFGSACAELRTLFAYLRTNPKAVSYLLFFAEQKSRRLLDVLARITLSSIYSHCYLPDDGSRVIEMLEELLSIYINFYKDIRHQMHASHSSFGLLYRSFCNELPELRNFFHLALYEPIMEVAGEDAYLDLDPAKAALRFDQKERERVLAGAADDREQYEAKLSRYREWVIKRLRQLVGHFIASLRAGIVAIPEVFARLIVTIYRRLVEHYNFEVCYSICTDLIFFYLLCPVIENPDAFGLVADLHLSPIARYNLLQCSQMLQTIALAKCEKVTSSYQEVCGHFDCDSLAFVIDHILALHKTHPNKPAPVATEVSFPLRHCLIAEFDLKLLLTYIGHFLEENQCREDNPLRLYFDQLKDVIHTFPVTFHKKRSETKRRPDSGGNNRQQVLREQELIESEIKKLTTTRVDNLDAYVRYLLASTQIIEVGNEGVQHSGDVDRMIGMCREDALLAKLKNSGQLTRATVENLGITWKVAKGALEIVYHREKESFAEQSAVDLPNSTFYTPAVMKSDQKKVGDFGNLIDMVFNGTKTEPEGGDNQSPPRRKEPADDADMSSMGPMSLSLAYDMAMVSEGTNNEAAEDADNGAPMSILRPSSPSFDLFGDHKLLSEPAFLTTSTSGSDVSTSGEHSDGKNIKKSNSSPGSSELVSSAASSAKKGFGSMLNNLKNLKDKVKNISLKDSRQSRSSTPPPTTTTTTSGDGSRTSTLNSTTTLPEWNSVERLSPTNLIDFDVSGETFQTESVQKKTIEILDKYRPSGAENLINIEDKQQPQQQQQQQQNSPDSVDQTTSELKVNRDVKAKLSRLMRLIDMASVYQSYRFLNLSNKNEFIMFLKVLLSQAHNVDNLTNVILLTDAIGLMEGVPDDAYYQSLLVDMSEEQCRRHTYQLYQVRARQHLLDRLARLETTTCAFLAKERHLIDFALVSCLVRLIIEQNLQSIKLLVGNFNEEANTADEKAEALHVFIERLLSENMAAGGLLGVLNARQALLARYIIERHLMATIYLLAFYPHGDADMARDRLLHQQIGTLAADRLFTGNISAKNLAAFPWPSAQRELHLLAAYKTPRDKVACVVRCCKHIGTLLNASGKSMASSADDSLPVLIYVVVKANPKSILSTIQFVNSFYSKDLQGEEAYYWTQFCSVVEYVKTILNQQ